MFAFPTVCLCLVAQTLIVARDSDAQSNRHRGTTYYYRDAYGNVIPISSSNYDSDNDSSGSNEELFDSISTRSFSPLSWFGLRPAPRQQPSPTNRFGGEQKTVISSASPSPSNAAAAAAAAVHCVVPSITVHETYTVDCQRSRDSCQSASRGTVAKNTQITFTCNAGYASKNGSVKFTSVCDGSGHWSPPLEQCKKKCDKIPSYLSVKCVDRSTNGDTVCPAVLREAAVVRVDCKRPYHAASSAQNHPPVTCSDNGTWEGEFVKCNRDCGRVPSSSSKKRTIDANPWTVAIYFVNPKPALTCAGTLVSSNMVITAAHCVYSVHEKTAFDPRHFEIVVAGNSGSVKAARNNQTLKSKVTRIFLPDNPSYNGGPRFEADLAVLRLEKELPVSETLLPACINHDDHRRFEPTQTTFGELTGFKTTNNGEEPSELQTATIPYMNLATCNQKIGEDYKNDLALDKFCTEYLRGEEKTFEDNGAGFVFQDPQTKLFYLRGVQSYRKEDSKNSIVVFTDVALYLLWLNNVFGEVDKSQSNIASVR